MLVPYKPEIVLRHLREQQVQRLTTLPPPEIMEWSTLKGAINVITKGRQLLGYIKDGGKELIEPRRILYAM